MNECCVGRSLHGRGVGRAVGTSPFGVGRALGGLDVGRVLSPGGFSVCGEVAGCFWCVEGHPVQLGKGSGCFWCGEDTFLGVGRALGVVV